MRFLRTLVGGALLSLAPVGAGGQEPATLDRVEVLVADGRAEEARDVLLTWWSGALASASRMDTQRGYWLRGRLTVDPAQADLDFRRLVVEYPGGAFSDRALLRLAQSAFARGDRTSAEAHVQRLAREYPSSPARLLGEAWLADVGRAPEGVRAAPAESMPAPVDRSSAGDRSPADVPERRSEYAVQLGAFANEDRARSLLDQVERAGFEARLVRVRGNDLARVRVGAFGVRTDADATLIRLRGQGLTAVLVADAHREVPIGR